jgi:hypothetical protein
MKYRLRDPHETKKNKKIQRVFMLLCDVQMSFAGVLND